MIRTVFAVATLLAGCSGSFGIGQPAVVVAPVPLPGFSPGADQTLETLRQAAETRALLRELVHR